MDCGENCPVTTTSSNWLISSLTSMFGEYVFPTGFDGDRKLLAVGGYGLDDHRIFARGSRKFEIAVPVGHPAEYRIFQRNRDVFGRSAVCGDDIARDFDLYPVLSRCGQDGQ